MKKLNLILITCIFLTNIVIAQPQWINYTNGNYISSILEEGNSFWVGTNVGLVKIDKTTGNKIFYNSANSGLPDNGANSIAIDGSGTKWIGTTYGGLAAFNENGIINSVNEQIEPVEHITVYPNPAHNQLTVIASRAKQSISIYNLQGQQVKSIQPKGECNKYIINVDNLPTGLYILKVSGDKGTELTKFIKY